MSAIKKIISVVIVGLAFSVHIFSQELEIKATVDKKSILIGDTLQYTISVSYPENLKVYWREYYDSFGQFEILKTYNTKETKKGNFTLKQKIFTISAYDSGLFKIQPFRIDWQYTGDSIIHEVFSDSIMIRVELVDADTSKPIKPILPPLGMPFKISELKPFIPWALAIIAIIIFVILLLRFIKKKPIIPMKPKPEPLPHEIALEQLKKLEIEKIWQKGEFKEYHIRISEIIRNYIENCFEVPAIESTTNETISFMEEKEIHADTLFELKLLLETSDLVKFAKLKPSDFENERSMEMAIAFIEKTKPSFNSNENLR